MLTCCMQASVTMVTEAHRKSRISFNFSSTNPDNWLNQSSFSVVSSNNNSDRLGMSEKLHPEQIFPSITIKHASSQDGFYMIHSGETSAQAPWTFFSLCATHVLVLKARER